MSVPRFSDIVGHHKTVKTLQTAIERGKVHHAYLLSGPAGIGKRTVATAFAASLLCAHGGPEACGSCPQCHQFSAGAQPNLRILGDGAKAIKVAEIRDLLRWVALKPMGGGRRAALLLAMERVGPSAANALLKTLEEPPPATTFILTTTNLSQALPTVRSRCQKISLSPLPEAQVEQILIRSHGMDKSRAVSLARAAGGSPGRALSLTDATLGFRDEVLDVLLNGENLSLSERFTTAEAHGKDKGRLSEAIDVCESLLRDGLVARSAPAATLVNDHRGDAIRRWAAHIPPQTLYHRLQGVEEARAAQAVNISGRVILERLYLTVSP